MDPIQGKLATLGPGPLRSAMTFGLESLKIHAPQIHDDHPLWKLATYNDKVHVPVMLPNSLMPHGYLNLFTAHGRFLAIYLCWYGQGHTVSFWMAAIAIMGDGVFTGLSTETLKLVDPILHARVKPWLLLSPTLPIADFNSPVGKLVTDVIGVPVMLFFSPYTCTISNRPWLASAFPRFLHARASRQTHPDSALQASIWS